MVWNPGQIPLRERRSLADEWNEFERAIGLRGCSDVQRIEMRRAFYGGAITMYNLAMTGLDEGSEPTELDIAYMESIQQEIADYGEELKREAGR